MIVAIPTINREFVTLRFGHMTEITFLEIEDGKIVREFIENITMHHAHGEHHHDCSGSHHAHDEHINPRHEAIKQKLQQCDELWYKSLCKNWRERLKEASYSFKRIDEDTLKEIVAKYN